MVVVIIFFFSVLGKITRTKKKKSWLLVRRFKSFCNNNNECQKLSTIETINELKL